MSTPAPPLVEPPLLEAGPLWRQVDFIADLHLQTATPATFASWLHYLETTPADAVFMLGDLFEAWVGDDVTQDPGEDGAFATRCADVLAFAAERLDLFFVRGNRDFLVGPAFLARCRARLLPDPTVLDFAGQRWLLSHGDALCLDDTEYQRFRAEVRSPAWQAAFLAKPLAERLAIARGLRAQSEARKRSAMVHADVDPEAARAWLASARAPTLIHGHTHRPAEHGLGPGLRRVVLSDWDTDGVPARAEVLRLGLDGGLQRHRLA